MWGYRSLLLHTLTPAKVVLLRRRIVCIITSGTTCIVQVGRAIKDAILAWGLALCVAASTRLPILRIQVPEQVLALLQERLLLALRILKDDKFTITHLCGRKFPLLRPLRRQLNIGSELFDLLISLLLLSKQFFLFVFIWRRGCCCITLITSILFLCLIFGVLMNRNKNTLSCMVAIYRQVSLRELTNDIIDISVYRLVVLGAIRRWNIIYHLIILEEDAISEHSYRQLFVKVSIMAFLDLLLSLVIWNMRRAWRLCQKEILGLSLWFF